MKVPPELVIDVVERLLRQRGKWMQELNEALQTGDTDQAETLVTRLAGVSQKRINIFVRPVRENVAFEVEMKEQ